MINYLSLNEKNLTKQPLFWLSIVIPCLGFIILGAKVWMDYDFGLNKAAYDKFLDVSKLPLLFLSLSVPLVAIVAHIHRTVQTEKQIEHTQKQIENSQKQISLLEEKNKPDSYYAHLKSMTEALTLIPSFNMPRAYSNGITSVSLSIKYPHPLYKKIFSKSNITDGYNVEINKHFQKKIYNMYRNLNNTILDAMNSTNEISLLGTLQHLESILIMLYQEISLNFSPEGHVFIIKDTNDTKEQNSLFSSEPEIKEFIKGVRNILIHLYQLLDIDDGFLRASPACGNTILEYIYKDRLIFDDFYPTMLRATSL